MKTIRMAQEGKTEKERTSENEIISAYETKILAIEMSLQFERF